MRAKTTLIKTHEKKKEEKVNKMLYPKFTAFRLTWQQKTMGSMMTLTVNKIDCDCEWQIKSIYTLNDLLYQI